MSEIKPWREYIGKHDAYIIMCDVLDALCEKEAIKKTVYERLKQAPSADRPSGEWVDNGDRYYRCSLCGTKDTDTWDWCHGCGCRMKGADDE